MMMIEEGEDGLKDAAVNLTDQQVVLDEQGERMLLDSEH